MTNARAILCLVDDFTSRDLMTRQEAFDMLWDLAEGLQTRMAALADEIDKEKEHEREP